MRLVNFADVHPNWSVVREFDATETKTMLEILVTATLLDGKVSRSEKETLADEYAQLPVGSSTVDSATVSQMFETGTARMKEFQKDPDQFSPYLDRVCSGIEGQEKGEAAVRLLAMLSVADGVTEEEFDYCRAVGYRLGLENDTVDGIIREAWEARQDYLVEHVPGVRRAIRPVTGAHFYEDRLERPHQYPFQQPETQDQRTTKG